MLTRAAVLCGLVLLLGCAQPPRTDPRPFIYSDDVKARIIRIARGEWQEWATAAPHPGEVAGRLRERRQGDLNENNERAFYKVLAYWSALPPDDHLRRNQAAFEANTPGDVCTAEERKDRVEGKDYNEWFWGCSPWSAAFISYVMRSAGVQEREFPRSAGHQRYVDHLIRQADAYPNTSPFIPHELSAYSPQPGDLICATRADGGAPYSLQKRREELGRSRFMHCDIVVDRTGQAGSAEIWVVGGNVNQGVRAERHRLDARDYLTPPRGSGVWFVVFENRMGRMRYAGAPTS